MLSVVKYDTNRRTEWNLLIENSRNGTFLFNRAFMEYHADRFVDCSLMFYKGDAPIGALPACINGNVVESHGGLTYGGIILHKNAHAADVEEMLDKAVKCYGEMGVKTLIFKPVPSIYHKTPSEDLEYWLFNKGARLSARSLSTTIDLDTPLPFSTLRKRKVKTAHSAGCRIEFCEDLTELNNFWTILTEVLLQKHGKKPVHTIDEITLLCQRFPDNIKLVVTKDASGETIAGTLLFISSKVIHCQYIASSKTGQETGALDLLFDQLVTYGSAHGFKYLDFGISTENDGHYLNKGLNFQKEGYGGRSVVYDKYTLDLKHDKISRPTEDL